MITGGANGNALLLRIITRGFYDSCSDELPTPASFACSAGALVHSRLRKPGFRTLAFGSHGCASVPAGPLIGMLRILPTSCPGQLDLFSLRVLPEPGQDMVPSGVGNGADIGHIEDFRQLPKERADRFPTLAFKRARQRVQLHNMLQ